MDTRKPPNGDNERLPGPNQTQPQGQPRQPAPPQNMRPRPGEAPPQSGQPRRPGQPPVPPQDARPRPKPGEAPPQNSQPRRPEQPPVPPQSARPRPNGKQAELDTGDENFEVKFDFDRKYKDVPEDRPLRQRREKRTGCVGGIMYAAFVICVSILLASLAWMAAVDVLGFASVDEEVIVTVPEEFTLDEIVDMLHDYGIIRHRFLFRWYANFSDAMDKITPGLYTLNRNFDYRAIVQGMTPGARTRVEVTVVIPEGFTLAQIFSLLDEQGVASEADLWYTATNHPFRHSFLNIEDQPHPPVGDRYRLEGFLFPETYNFFINESPVQAINRMLNQFGRRFTEEYRERAEEMGFSVRDIVNVAAMIERETGSHAESPRIASVIYNRLESPNFPFLQIDAVIFYAVNFHEQGAGLPFSLSLDHPFNTHIHQGLPPGPIANPGIASIRAALFPDETRYYFYALHVDGHHVFNRTYAAHNAFVNSDQFAGSAV